MGSWAVGRVRGAPGGWAGTARAVGALRALAHGAGVWCASTDAVKGTSLFHEI